MIAYYKDDKICINFKDDFFAEPDVEIEVKDDVILVDSNGQVVEIPYGGEITTYEEDGKVIIDLDPKTEEVDGFEMEIGTESGAGSVVVKEAGETVMEITEEGTKDKEDIEDETAADDGNTCKIGNQYFTTLKEAFDSAEPGSAITIKMIADETGAGLGLFTADGDENKDITIDFDGHKYIASSPAVGSKGTQTQALHLEMNNKVTLKNGEFTSDRGAADVKMLIQNYCDLTLDHMVCDCADDASITYVCSNNFGNCLIKDSELIAHPSRVALDCWFGLGKTYDAEGVRVTAQNSKLSSTIEYGAQRAALNREGNENWFERTILTLNGCEFGCINNSGAGANDVHNIVIDGTRYEGELPIVVEG